jgi:hypothetical protein
MKPQNSKPPKKIYALWHSDYWRDTPRGYQNFEVAKSRVELEMWKKVFPEGVEITAYERIKDEQS